MLNNRNNRSIVFFLILIIFLGAVAAGQYIDRRFCMDVLIIDEEKLEQYIEGLYPDLGQLIFCGEKVPLDINRNMIYITQSNENLDHYSHLKGSLRMECENSNIFFVENEAIRDPRKAMLEGNPLTLVVISGQYFCRLRVVLTTLPVLCINGIDTEHYNEHGRRIKTGDIALFSNDEESTDHISVKSGLLEWYTRGGITSYTAKTPWKLSLKDANGQNRNEDFLGMGEDDDWILNSMVMDDTKIREKFMMETWNQYVNATDDAYKMSMSEYVEVVINGVYHGLYLLQRRIDEKYLDLNRKEDILFKTSTSLKKGYEIVYSPFETEKTYEILDCALKNNDLDINAFINTDLYLHFYNALDNMVHKNMFYVFKSTPQGYRIHLLPWDTDMALGIMWREGFVYDFDVTVKELQHRKEYETIRNLNSSFDTLYRERWNELRNTAFSPERMKQYITNARNYLENSGVYKRDQYIWGSAYKGKDTCEELIRWCIERVKVFDLEYSKLRQ